MVLFRLCVSDYCLIQMSHVQLYHGELNSQSNDWLDWNQNDVSEWSDMSTRRLSFQ
jgi:hypothetical protein